MQGPSRARRSTDEAPARTCPGGETPGPLVLRKLFPVHPGMGAFGLSWALAQPAPAAGLHPGEGRPRHVPAMTADRLAQLYRQYGPAIYARCRRILGEGEAAEDATQETFMRLLRQLERAPDLEVGLAYVYRVATNHCLNCLRDARLRPEPVGQLPELPAGDWEGLVLDIDTVRRLLAQLPGNLREVVWLHHVDGLDQAEVARVLGVSRRTIVNRLAEVRAHVQRFQRRAHG
jgi:RNA polymerase sigma-70 factor, ECF subfamily